ELEEVQRQVVGDAVQVGVGELALAVDQRDAVRVLVEDGGEFLRERLVLPVALFAVAARELGREGHYTGKRHAFSRKWGRTPFFSFESHSRMRKIGSVPN